MSISKLTSTQLATLIRCCVRNNVDWNENEHKLEPIKNGDLECHMPQLAFGAWQQANPELADIDKFVGRIRNWINNQSKPNCYYNVTTNSAEAISDKARYICHINRWTCDDRELGRRIDEYLKRDDRCIIINLLKLKVDEVYTINHIIDFLRSCIRSNLAWNPDTNELITRNEVHEDDDAVYAFGFGLWCGNSSSPGYQYYSSLMMNWRIVNKSTFEMDALVGKIRLNLDNCESSMLTLPSAHPNGEYAYNDSVWKFCHVDEKIGKRLTELLKQSEPARTIYNYRNPNDEDTCDCCGLSNYCICGPDEPRSVAYSILPQLKTKPTPKMPSVACCKLKTKADPITKPQVVNDEPPAPIKHLSRSKPQVSNDDDSPSMISLTKLKPQVVNDEPPAPIKHLSRSKPQVSNDCELILETKTKRCFVCCEMFGSKLLTLIATNPAKGAVTAKHNICAQCKHKSNDYLYIYEYMIQNQSAGVKYINIFARLMFEGLINDIKIINNKPVDNESPNNHLRKCLGHEVDIEVRINIINALKIM